MLVGGRTAPLATLLPLTMRRTVVAAHLETALATNTRVRRLRRLGLRLCTWTVNDVVRAKELVAAGVDWLITDAPGVMVQALRTNAQSSQ